MKSYIDGAEQPRPTYTTLTTFTPPVPPRGFSGDLTIILLMYGPTDGTVVYAPEQWKAWTGHDIGYHSDGWDDKAMQPFTGRVILEHHATL